MTIRFVSTSGSPSNPGTIGAPWDMAKAISATGPSPGDTVMIRGGTYLVPTASKWMPKAQGTLANPITYQPYNNERVKIDCVNGDTSYAAFYCFADSSDNTAGPVPGTTGNPLSGYAAYLYFRELEIYSSINPKPNPFNQAGFFMRGSKGCKLIHCITHDLGFGVDSDVDTIGGSNGGNAVDLETNSCIAFYNGKAGSGNDGHGFYRYANLAGAQYSKQINNISAFNASYGVHTFPHAGIVQLSNTTDNYNILFGAGLFGNQTIDAEDLLVGGQSQSVNPIANYNVIYEPSSRRDTFRRVQVGFSNNGTDGTTFQGNYITGWTRFVGSAAATVGGAGGLANNFRWSTDYETSYGTAPTNDVATRFPNNTFAPTGPVENKVFVYKSDYNGVNGYPRGHIAIFNGALAASVNVDLSPILGAGAVYEIRQALNFYGTPVVSGNYPGSGTIGIPMNATVNAYQVPLGGDATPANLAPEFAAFVVVQTNTLPFVTPTGTLPGGTVGTAYSQQMSAGGGTPPYTFDISAGSLPTSLTISAAGLISGTPTVAGTFNFTVRVTDSLAAVGTAACLIVIAPAVSGSGVGGTVGIAII